MKRGFVEKYIGARSQILILTARYFPNYIRSGLQLSPDRNKIYHHTNVIYGDPSRGAYFYPRS